MNQSHDVASELSETARRLPFPPEQRRRVFIPRAGYITHDLALEAAWSRWGGETDFIYNPNEAGTCGLCIFSKGALGPANELAAAVQPFFDRHGIEANVFEYDTPAKTFRRINPEWLRTYYPR